MKNLQFPAVERIMLSVIAQSGLQEAYIWLHLQQQNNLTSLKQNCV